MRSNGRDVLRAHTGGWTAASPGPEGSLLCLTLIIKATQYHPEPDGNNISLTRAQATRGHGHPLHQTQRRPERHAVKERRDRQTDKQTSSWTGRQTGVTQSHDAVTPQGVISYRLHADELALLSSSLPCSQGRP